jgi:prevent-host-death family protein
MKTLNIHYAKTHLSRILEEVMMGEEICIAKAGKPMVKVIPYIKSEVKRVPGLWKGKIKVGKAFFDPVHEQELWG